MKSLALYLPIFLALYVLTKQFLNKIRRLPPSPFLELPIIGHLYLLKRPIHRTLSNLSKRHGPILLLRFGSRRVLVVSSPPAAEECFTKNDIVFANRPSLMVGKHMGCNFTSLAWAPYGDHWRNLRRVASLEILSSSRLQLLSNIRADEVKSLVRRLFHNQLIESVDLRMEIYDLTMNVMMRMIAGKRYYGKHVANLEEAKRFKEVLAATFKVAAESNIGDFLPWFKSRDLEKRMIRCRKMRDECTQYLIEERRRNRRIPSNCSGDEKTIETLIEVLLALQETDPECYNDQTIGSLMLVLIGGGTDTTTNTMEWALSLLLNHPEILKNAQREIDNQVGHGRLMDESDMARLPYLGSIINETLRMYPPAPMLMPHESSDECTVLGYRIPRGTTLLVNIWAIQNDPKIWEDPRKFKPERFQGHQGARDGFRMMPFGSGRRGCPGEGLGLKMVGLALGSLIQCFEWERIGEEMVDMREGTGVTMPKARPLQAKCLPRPTMVSLLSQI